MVQHIHTGCPEDQTKLSNFCCISHHMQNFWLCLSPHLKLSRSSVFSQKFIQSLVHNHLCLLSGRCIGFILELNPCTWPEHLFLWKGVADASAQAWQLVRPWWLWKSPPEKLGRFSVAYKQSGLVNRLRLSNLTLSHQLSHNLEPWYLRPEFGHFVLHTHSPSLLRLTVV